MKPLFIYFFIFIYSISNSYSSYSIPKIKVKIRSSLKTVFISGTDIKRTNFLKKNTKSFAGKKAVKFNCKKVGKRKKSNNRPILLASLISQTGLISLKNKKRSKTDKYDGKILIATSPNGNSCDVINEVPMENYISTLLSKEMNGNWPVEALKAQAIAARTYAFYKIENNQMSKKLGHPSHYDIESSEKHQVSGDFFDTTVNTLKAAKKTKGEVLFSKDGTLTPIFFHARCGGHTILPKTVWKNRVKGYKGVKCPFCRKDKKSVWAKSISMNRFIKFLSWGQEKNYIKKTSSLDSKSFVKLIPDKKNKNLLKVYLGDELFFVKKPLLRRYFGRVLFPSNYYQISYSKSQKKFFTKGSGLGHGVGMCQLGALDLARKGWSYKKILAYYFPGHKIINLNKQYKKLSKLDKFEGIDKEQIRRM